MSHKKVWHSAELVADAKQKTVHHFHIKTQETVDTDRYLLKENNLSDLQDRDLARRNLGITVSAVAPLQPKTNDLWIDLTS